MIGLAHCDGNFHPLEKIYIKQIGMDLGIPDSLINDIVDIDGEVAFQRLVQTDNQNKQTTPEALSSANGNPQRDSEAAGYANTVVELNQRIIDQRLEDITNHGIERIHFLPTVRKIMNNECPELIAALNRKYDRNRVNGSRNILAMWYLDLLFGYIAQADMKIPSATSRKYVSNLNDLELWTRPEKRRFQNANQL
jgi:hypothetical protein